MLEFPILDADWPNTPGWKAAGGRLMADADWLDSAVYHLNPKLQSIRLLASSKKLLYYIFIISWVLGRIIALFVLLIY